MGTRRGVNKSLMGESKGCEGKKEKKKEEKDKR